MAPTYLRVKRPRHVASLPYLCVEGLSEAGSKRSRPDTLDNLACLLHQSTYIAAQQQQRRPAVSAVWKRVDVDCTDTAGSLNQKRRFVDAVLDDIDDDDYEGPRTKRPRRLALTLVRDVPHPAAVAAVAPFATTATTTVSKKNVILDPLSRMVQESLQSVLSGERSVSQHLDMLSSDVRFSDKTRHWLQFTGTTTAGNILHISALCNDVGGALAVLAWEIPSLLQQVDADGQTPHQLAVAIGHSQVARVFEVHSGDDDREEDYVYDVFLLDKDMPDHDKEDTMTCVELRGGVGYWDEHGELILEAMEDEGDSDNDENDDSNCEDYHGNDYPEEDDDEYWEEDDIVEVDETFRHRPVHMFGQDVQVSTKPPGESDDDEYDTEYGLYEPSGPQRQYAYDPDYESD